MKNVDGTVLEVKEMSMNWPVVQQHFKSKVFLII